MPVPYMQTLSSLILLYDYDLFFKQISLLAIVSILQLSLPDGFELHPFLNLIAAGTNQIEYAILPETIIPPLETQRRIPSKFVAMGLNFFGLLKRFLNLIISQSELILIVLAIIALKLIQILPRNLNIIQIHHPLQHSHFPRLIQKNTRPVPPPVQHLPYCLQLLQSLTVVPAQIVQPSSVLLTLRRMHRTTPYQLLQPLLTLLLKKSSRFLVQTRLLLYLQLSETFDFVGLRGSYILPHRQITIQLLEIRLHRGYGGEHGPLEIVIVLMSVTLRLVDDIHNILIIFLDFLITSILLLNLPISQLNRTTQLSLELFDALVVLPLIVDHRLQQHLFILFISDVLETGQRLITGQADPSAIVPDDIIGSSQRITLRDDKIFMQVLETGLQLFVYIGVTLSESRVERVVILLVNLLLQIDRNHIGLELVRLQKHITLRSLHRKLLLTHTSYRSASIRFAIHLQNYTLYQQLITSLNFDRTQADRVS